jgi:alpha-mannosidase
MQGKAVPRQVSINKKQIIFKADVPSMGYNTYKLAVQKATVLTGAKAVKTADGKYTIETDQYQLIINPAKGGVIESMVAKTLDSKQFVDQANPRGFNELRGNFYNDGGFKSSEDKPAEVTILENGPINVQVQVKGIINKTPFTQLISLTQGQPKIDVWLTIDWSVNTGIGLATAPNTYKANGSKKSFYDDRYKLLTLFPLKLQGQKVYKNAPFDVMESKLDNTFFGSWDSIKNNVVLNWVDVTDSNDAYGMAMYTDHTTNYNPRYRFPAGVDYPVFGCRIVGT